MDIPSPISNPWFAEIEDVDDPMLLQEFVGDCLVDCPPENMGSLMEDPELHYTLSPGSECNSSTAAGDISNAESNQHSPAAQQHLGSSPDEGENRPTKVTKRPRRLPDQCQNHIIAERQRRQNLSQLFIALSALIPDLKKMDKTSVIGEAITHMKQLKEKLKILEEENARRSAESVVMVQRSRANVEDECHSTTSNDSLPATDLIHDEQLPEVEARFSNRSVLIRVHCQMRPGVLSKMVNKIENLNLLVTNTSSMPFNNTTLDITIMTQMEPDFNMRPQEVVANLRSIFW